MSGRIVAYGTRGILAARFARRSNWKRRGRIAGALWRNRKTVGSAFKQARRSFNNRKRKAGATPAPSTNRRRENIDQYETSSVAFLSLKPKTLKWNIIKGPASGTQMGEINSDFVRVVGVDMCLRASNRLVAEGRGRVPIMLHFGILQPKCHEKITGNEDMQKDFFRAYNNSSGNGRVDAIDFVEGGETNLKYDCNPINTRKWNVLMHKRIKVAGEATGNQANSHIVDFKKWTKIGRRYRLANNGTGGDVEFQQPFYWFMYYQPLELDVDPDWDPNAPDKFKYQIRTKLVFSDR